METISWKEENFMVEQHRQRYNRWRRKGYTKEERETYQVNAGKWKQMNTARGMKKMDVETHKKDAEDSSNMDEEKASCFK